MGRLMSDKGFSLIEALISLAIMAVGVMAIIVMLDTAFATNRLSRDYTNAANVSGFIYDTIRNQATNENGAANRTKIATFDNDATSAIVLDTEVTTAPLSEPGKSAYEEWKNMIESNFRKGRGIVTIIVDDPNYANNTSVSIRIEWASSSAIDRYKTFLTVLYPTSI